MLISIIVPVYNTQQYLSECLESILKQTYQNIEVILVDDGSEDESLKTCMEYAQKEPKIIVVQNRHQGVVATRKSGVKQASGQYCMFVDSDDWIEKDLIDAVLTLTDSGNIDIVNYNMKSVYPDKSLEWRYTIKDGVYEFEQLEYVYKKMMFDFENGYPGIIQSLSTKLIKRDILLSAIENVDDRITMGEDAAVVYKAMLLAKRVAVTSNVFYYYRVNQGSMSNTKDFDIFMKISCFHKYMQKVFAEYRKEYRLNDQLQMYLIHFIEKGVGDIFSLKTRRSYCIPYKALSDNRKKKIVLYGAGNVGRSYFRQFTYYKNVDLVAWVDRSLCGQIIYDFEIRPISSLKELTFDEVVIAVKDQQIAMEIKEQLRRIYPGHEFVWIPPKINWWEIEIDV